MSPVPPGVPPVGVGVGVGVPDDGTFKVPLPWILNDAVAGPVAVPDPVAEVNVPVVPAYFPVPPVTVSVPRYRT